MAAPAAVINEKRRQQKRDLVALLGGKCVRCGFDGHPAAFHFHHRDPEAKDCTIGSMLGNTSWERIVEEAGKCELLCANCHAIETYDCERVRAKKRRRAAWRKELG